MKESEQIAASAKKNKDWGAATSALREARSCLELLAKLRGELQAPGALHLHRHQHVHAAGSLRQTEVELDTEIAKQIAQATDNFDPQEIASPAPSSRNCASTSFVRAAIADTADDRRPLRTSGYFPTTAQQMHTERAIG